jgi:hypothetical protein
LGGRLALEEEASGEEAFSSLCPAIARVGQSLCSCRSKS